MKHRFIRIKKTEALAGTMGFLMAMVSTTQLAVADTNTTAPSTSTNAPAVTNAPAEANRPQTEVAPELQVADQLMVSVPRKGFGKEYLFTASIIPQGSAATSKGLTGKVVRFELFPDGVDLYESIQGLVVTEDLPARRLLATFPIVRQDDQQVVIDFNKGMRRLFTQAWTSGGPLSEEHDQVLDVPEGRVFETRQNDGQLIIRQSVQARNRENDQNLEQRYEVRYFLKPYRQGAAPAKEPSIADSRYTKYFMTEGKLEPGTGRMASHIARFDIRQPIVFYYSANTPADYVEAVKDGILYWNRVYGKDIVQAKKAPEGATAPDASMNIIQWVPWDNAGFAYADVLNDPFTGQSLHGQAYITSVFGFMGKARARVLLRNMQDLAEKKEDKKDDKKRSVKFGAPFLDSAPCCEVDNKAYAEAVVQGLQELLANDKLTDEAVLRTSQDYVREVVCHEVGHVLGLRHNFAGSLASTLSHKELDEWYKAYVLGKPLDAYTNKLSTSSIMEYTVFKAAVFTGWHMRTVTEPLPHDKAAIGWGYMDSSEAREKKMLFATDGDAMVYGDVTTFDYGCEPVVSSYAEIASLIDLLPNSVIETFISARAPRNPLDRVPLDQVNLSAESYAGRLSSQFSEMLQWFRADVRSLAVENQFDYIGELNRKERYEAHWKYLNSQIDELGGVDRAIFSFLPVDLKLELKQEPTNVPVVKRLNAAALTAELEKLLDSPGYKTFVGLDEKKYSFTKEEHDLIVKRSRLFFEQLEKDVVKRVCQRLSGARRNLGSEASGSVSEEDNIAKFEKRIIELAKLVITAKDENRYLEGKLDKGIIKVPEYKYDQETRLAAARALDDQVGSFRGWSEEAKSELNNQLKGDVETALLMSHFKDFKVAMLSRPIREWYQKQLDILAMLPPAPGNQSLPAR